TLSYIDKPSNPTGKPTLWDRPLHFDLCAPHVNAPPPHLNVPVLPRQPMGPRAPQLPFLTNSPYTLPVPMPNPPANTNYFGPPTPRGPPPPQWALRPPLGNAGQLPGGSSGGWGLAMDNFLLQHGNGNNYYYYYNARPPPQTQNTQDNTHDALAQEEKLNIQKPKLFTGHNPPKWCLEDALDCGPDPNVFSTPATLLHTTVLTLDNFLAHLPFHSSTTLLLCTTLPFSDNFIPTLVNNSTTDNFIDKSLAALALHLLWHLPTPIPLKLFNGDPTPAGNITHHLETTMTFAKGQQQEL
ncbi:hypothetical protein C0989_001984, partial [Termitomyces sp. Mn162]